VAVKVQRPDALAILAKDYLAFVVSWSLVEQWWKLKGGFDNGDIRSVVDRVAGEVLNELEYRKEAKNSKAFEASLDFLGFVGTPDVVPQYSTSRVLVTEWVQGQHLSNLSAEAGLRMTRMAIEACTASLVLTGYVHADPHEGNLMLADDGQIIFLDFGLMSVVEPRIMEAFASGIQAALAEDYEQLAIAFKDTGFVNDPVQYKSKPSEPFRAFGLDPQTGLDLGLAKFTEELAGAMQRTEGGSSRFGALATVLNQELAPRWKMFTPPYILLLIRTFLTLEGLAERVDPDFNIYEMAMPWAVRRSLSPESSQGVAALRGMCLTEDQRVQWPRLLEMFDEFEAAQAAKPAEQAGESEEAARKSASNDAAKTAAMNDAVGSLLGSRPGSTLRRTLSDIDSTDLAKRLVSPSARPLRRAATVALANALADTFEARRLQRLASREAAAGGAQVSVPAGEEARPVSEAALRLRRVQEQRRAKVLVLLAKSHLSRQLRKGLDGFVALSCLFYLTARVGLSAGLRAARQVMLRSWRRVRGSRGATESDDGYSTAGA